MGRLRSGGLWSGLAIILLLGAVGCGGHTPPRQSPFPATITISPAATTSLQLGSIILFTASARNASNQVVNLSVAFVSSDTSILNLSPSGIACAGHWDSTFSICTPGGVGLVQVTALVNGTSSAPTLVFVHAPIDNIVVTGILPANQTVQEPCLSQSQTMLLQAQAFSQGQDISATVGPFTFTANNTPVVTFTPKVNQIVINGTTYDIAINQATATAAAPGWTKIFALAGGVTSSLFTQPQIQKTINGTVQNSPVFDFFETCPIQSIQLELTAAGSTLTSFAGAKGLAETAIATVTDVQGHSSLRNNTDDVVLNKTPLTWTSSQAAVVNPGNGCTQSCNISTPSPGAAAVTASCTPPTCNIGFPQVPTSLSTPQQLAACAAFFQLTSCQQFIPVPVYASPTTPLLPNSTGAIPGVLTGTPLAATVLATSTGCDTTSPNVCTTSIYSVSTTNPVPSTPTASPSSPNSLIFDHAGDKAFLGSNFGPMSLTPSSIGTANSAFTALGPFTGSALAVSTNGTMAVFSSANQVFVTNTTPQTVTPLNISNAAAAAFSPDGLKAFIFGFDNSTNPPTPSLYIYSPLQALQVVNLPPQTTVNSIAFSTDGAFAYVVEPSLGGAGAAVTVYNTCNNQVAQDTLAVNQIIPLSAPPIAFRALPDGVNFLALHSDGSFDHFAATLAPVTPATLSQPATGSPCPLHVSHQVLPTFSINQGSIQPVNFFVSPDATLLYIIASNSARIFVYSFITQTTFGIPLQGGVTPISADMSIDTGTVAVAGSDGQLHLVSTANGGNDNHQIPFPILPNFSNPFCTFAPTQVACTLNFVAVKP
jgi:hypothetical protein